MGTGRSKQEARAGAALQALLHHRIDCSHWKVQDYDDDI